MTASGTAEARVAGDALTFERSGRRILTDITFRVKAGRITGLLGTNGAGKSTLIKLILGLIKPTAGTLTVLGGAPGEAPLKIGYLPENVSFYDQMTVAEHLRFFGRLKRVDAARIAAVGEKLRLTEFARRTPKECSKGQRQRLGLAQALLTELLLLDEPTTGLDPQTTEALYAELVQMKEKGCAVLICTHELALAENFLDCVLMIKEGRIAAQAETLDALRAKANLPVRVTLTPAAAKKARAGLPAWRLTGTAIDVAPGEVQAVLAFLTQTCGIWDFEVRHPDLRSLYAYFNGTETTHGAS